MSDPNKNDTNGHPTASHFASPQDLSDQIEWRNELLNDRTKVGRCRCCFLFSFQAFMKLVELFRCLISLLVALIVGNNTFINTEDVSKSISNGFVCGVIMALLVEVTHTTIRRLTAIKIEQINAHAYVEHGPTSVWSVAFSVLVLISVIGLGIQAANILRDCSGEESATFTIDYIVCNN